MVSYLQNISKGSTYKLYLSTLGTIVRQSVGGQPYVSSPAYTVPFASITDAGFKISKDGGAFAQTTNAPVEISSGHGYVILTADEMNADVIMFKIQYGGGGSYNSTSCVKSVIILTGTIIASTSQSPETMTSIAKAVNLGYAVTQIAIGEDGYNYYGLINGGRKPWWMIIREKTDFTDVEYKMNKTNRQTFDVGWEKRATLNYGEQFPLK